MQRPNRIGAMPIVNLNNAYRIDTNTAFGTMATPMATISTSSLNAASGLNHAFERKFYTDLTGVTLNNVEQVGLGVQINNTREEKHRFQYTVYGHIMYDKDSHLNVEFCVGRLDGAPSETVAVNVPNASPLPLDYFDHSGQVVHAGICKSFVTTEKNGGTPPATYNDLAAFWRIVNITGGNVDIKGLTLSVGLYQWVEDLQTFEPPRA